LPDTNSVTCQVIGGDTLIAMHLDDAKIVLKGVLDGEVADSLVKVLVERDKVKNGIIELQTKEIKALQEQSKNKDQQRANLDAIIKNKNTEIATLKAIIAEQKREIRKQKIIKTLALIGDVVLPVVTLLYITTH
jgi:septal ring factor EnvC (AmiA/AmiB activator)